MSRKMIAIQARGGQVVKPIRSSTLEKSVNHSLRASFSLEGSSVNNATWAKMETAAQYLTKVN